MAEAEEDIHGPPPSPFLQSLSYMKDVTERSTSVLKAEHGIKLSNSHSSTRNRTVKSLPEATALISHEDFSDVKCTICSLDASAASAAGVPLWGMFA